MTQTFHSWIITPPFFLKKSLEMPLSEAEQKVESAWKLINKDSIDILLRSVGYDPFLINQRFFYFLHIATTKEEKLRCLLLNITDLSTLIDLDKKNENLYGVLFTFQSLLMAELYWEENTSRPFAEEIWNAHYALNDPFLESIGLHGILLSRLPLLKKLKKSLVRYLINFPEENAIMAYAKALYLFSKDRFSNQANKTLEKAIELNPHVPKFLLIKKQIPKKPIQTIEPSQVSEAKYIGFISGESWWSIAGAIDFLKSNLKK